ncbi:ATP-grasp domain-containing protein [Spartinivicinus ruber]|uniref:carboxylate--amine ligase n=1 Tax=Spartinivicinus ruber TaxID=2683272 RepID=UPI0013D36D1F|nr:carboxylate--amine ligase [Spartinivicinus ruber]
MNKKIVITGAGSAQSNATINCLLMADDGETIVGPGADPVDLMFCRAHKRYLVPHASQPNHKESLLRLLEMERPDMIHFQHDLEVWKALQFQDEIEALGIKMLVPSFETVDTCVHKYKSWLKFKEAGIQVPENIVLNEPSDLRRALRDLGDENGTVWLRSMSIGNGGKGSLAANDFEEAEKWINRNNGWGEFTAAEILTDKTVTWLCIYVQGELIVAQGRSRHSWAYSAMSPSGVTGITRVCETVSNPQVDEIAVKSIKSVMPVPHGIFGVDMTYDRNGIPNPTEINVSRFFTTIQFFAEAGLNMPKILKDIVLYDKLPNLECPENPLPDGLLWLRALDAPPILTTEGEINDTLLKV